MFVHLHGHSTYSLLEAIGDVGDVVKRASKLGQHAVAVTDYNGMYGAGYFYKKTKGSDVKPLIGVELPFVYDL